MVHSRCWGQYIKELDVNRLILPMGIHMAFGLWKLLQWNFINGALAVELQHSGLGISIRVLALGL